MKLALFDIDYFKMRLNVLESFEEGEFILAKKIKFVRKYVHCTKDSAMYTHVSEIFDHTLTEYKGSVGMLHGFSQC